MGPSAVRTTTAPTTPGDVWADAGGLNIRLFEGNGSSVDKTKGVERRLDPVAARNLAALLVRASEESERMHRERMHDEVP